MESKTRKLSVTKKFGYSVGQLTDSIGFNAFYFFFLFFLTDYAGIPPAAAGTISMIAVAWDALTDPVIGNISDNLKSKHGRRRPLMFTAAFPYAFCTFLLFHNVNLSANAKFIYFTAAAIMFWSCYKVFVIPFFALGAELTDDFHERTSLRSWASIFLYLAVMIASAAPPMILKVTETAGGSGIQGWNNVGISFGILILLSALVCWRLTRGGEPQHNLPAQDETGGEDSGLIKNILDVIKLKTVRILGCSVFAWATVTAFLSSGPVYLMTNNLKYTEERMSSFFIFMTLMSIVWIPVINYGSNILGKRKVYYGTMLISTIGFVVFGLLGFSSFAMLLLFIAIFAFGNCAFWTIYYSMMYDISELDEFVSGKRREGCISALMSLFQKFGSAFCMWMIGILLGFAHYDAGLDIQPQSAQNMILYINTLIPALFGAVAVICAFLYPLTADRFSALMTALQAKRASKEYSTKGFEELL